MTGTVLSTEAFCTRYGRTQKDVDGSKQQLIWRKASVQICSTRACARSRRMHAAFTRSCWRLLSKTRSENAALRRERCNATRARWRVR